MIVHIIRIECRLLRAHSDLSTKYHSRGIDLWDKSEISTNTWRNFKVVLRPCTVYSNGPHLRLKYWQLLKSAAIKSPPLLFIDLCLAFCEIMRLILNQINREFIERNSSNTAKFCFYLSMGFFFYYLPLQPDTREIFSIGKYIPFLWNGRPGLSIKGLTDFRLGLLLMPIQWWESHKWVLVPLVEL